MSEGVRVTTTDLDNGDTETVVFNDNYVIVNHGVSYLSSLVAYANGTAILTVKKAASAGEARGKATKITRHFGAAALKASS